MDILIAIVSFAAGVATCWFFKGAIAADLTSLHAKVDAIISAVKARV